MGRQRIENLARDMKVMWCRTGSPVVRLRGHLRIELSSPKADWWRLVASRRGATVLTDEDTAELRDGFKIPEEVLPERTVFGELAFEWDGREERRERA